MNYKKEFFRENSYYSNIGYALYHTQRHTHIWHWRARRIIS